MEKHNEFREIWLSLWAEEKITELKDLISSWIFKTIIHEAKDIEFKLKPWKPFVWVYHSWNFLCYISSEEYHQFVDEDSIINTHFDIIKKII